MNDLNDMLYFAEVVERGGFAAAGRALGIPKSRLSRRVAELEGRLGVRLLQRTTRRIHLTPEGETYLLEGARILAELDALERTVAGARSLPRGPLKIACTLGFGRTRLAPALSAFARAYPQVQVQLHLTERPVNLVEQGFDAVVRFGEQPDSLLTARRLLRNRRVLCASPRYLAQAGEPRLPSDLLAHRCIVIRESDETYGSWQLRQADLQETVKVNAALSTNDGGAALAWALDDQGILQRSIWDIEALLAAGELREVLPGWKLPPADIYLVHASKSELSAKIRALSEFLRDWFDQPG